MKRFIALLGVTFLVTACAGEKVTKVSSIQKKDKDLSCTEVLLEMNEAEFHRNTAHNKKMPSLKNVVMPLGYMSTYMNSEDAIQAADSRIGYLNKIYEIMKCDEQENQRYGDSGKDDENKLALAKAEQPQAMRGAPAPYVQVREQAAYAPAAYGQPRYLASAPYADGYTPIRQRYEQRRNRDSQKYYGYGYAAPAYEESIPEGAPIRSRY